jgi:tetratricopeptide (TPR) repeat protein
VNLSELLYYQKNHRGSVALCDEAIRLRPDDAMAHHYRGHAYVRLDRLDKALADYSRAIALTPDYAPAYRSRALVYSRLRQFE